MLVSPTPALTARTRRDPKLVSCIYCGQQINCLRRTCPYLIQLIKKIPYNINMHAIVLNIHKKCSLLYVDTL